MAGEQITEEFGLLKTDIQTIVVDLITQHRLLDIDDIIK